MTNPFNSSELYKQLRYLMSESLPSLMKTYVELKKRAEICDGPLVVSINDMALDWESLVSLVNYHIIDYRTNNTNDEWIITFLIS